MTATNGFLLTALECIKFVFHRGGERRGWRAANELLTRTSQLRTG